MTGIVAAILSFIFTIDKSLVVPAWLWGGLAALSLAYAGFAAFHDVRVERDSLVALPKLNSRIALKDRLVTFRQRVHGVFERPGAVHHYQPSDEDLEQLAEEIREFLSAALGEGEATLFAQKAWFTPGEGVDAWRMREQLDSILERVDTIEIREDWRP